MSGQSESPPWNHALGSWALQALRVGIHQLTKSGAATATRELARFYDALLGLCLAILMLLLGLIALIGGIWFVLDPSLRPIFLIWLGLSVSLLGGLIAWFSRWSLKAKP